MYGLLWRLLPGPWVVRALLALALVVAVVAALWTVAFPYVEARLPVSDVTVGDG